jgi:hypothetical protein
VRKRFTLSVILLLLHVSILSANAFGASLFNKANAPHQMLLFLLKKTNIPHDRTKKTILKETQKEWLRKPMEERWEMKVGQYESEREAFMRAFEALGYVKGHDPKYKSYTGAVVMGATLPRVLKRLNYLLKLLKQGIRIEKIYFLSGQRPLDPKVDILPPGTLVAHDTSSHQTEVEMMVWVYNQMDFAPYLGDAQPIIIDSSMKMNADGVFVRPITDDTIEELRKTQPMKKGRYLVISNWPYATYQGKVFKSKFDILQKDKKPMYAIETVGEDAVPSLPIEIYLDTIARDIYANTAR